MDEIHALQSTTQSLLADKSYIEAYLNTLRSSSLVLKELAKSVDPKSSTLLFDLAHSLLTDARDTAKKIGSSSKQKGEIITTAKRGGDSAPVSDSTIPSIPVSQHTLEALDKQKKLELANLRYSNAVSQNSPLSDLRRMLEDKRILESQVELLTLEIEGVATSNFAYWRPENMASAINSISTSLFQAIDPRKDLNSVVSQTTTSINLKACLDFNTYLERIVISALVSIPKSSVEENESSLLAITMQSVLHAIYHLIYTFGDISSAIVLLMAVNSPAVSRLSKSWSFLNPQTKALYKNLSLIIPFADSPINDHVEITSKLLNTRTGIIPLLLPILKELELINQLYDTGAGNNVPVLTEVGAKSMEKLLGLVEACKGVSTTGWDATVGDLKIPKDAILKSIFVNMPAKDGRADGKLVHFVLSRVFYQNRDLWHKSTVIEPLGKQEVVPEFEEISVIVTGEDIEAPVIKKLGGDEDDELSYLDDLVEKPSAIDEIEELSAIEKPSVTVEPRLIDEPNVIKALSLIDEPSAIEESSSIEEPVVVDEPSMIEKEVKDGEVDESQSEVMDELEARLARLNRNE